MIYDSLIRWSQKHLVSLISTALFALLGMALWILVNSQYIFFMRKIPGPVLELNLWHTVGSLICGEVLLHMDPSNWVTGFMHWGSYSNNWPLTVYLVPVQFTFWNWMITKISSYIMPPVLIYKAGCQKSLSNIWLKSQIFLRQYRNISKIIRNKYLFFFTQDYMLYFCFLPRNCTAVRL